jgi:hypothetical protein
LLPICEITDQLDMMSAGGYQPKSPFFVDRRCHARIKSVQFVQFNSVSPRTSLLGFTNGVVADFPGAEDLAGEHVAQVSAVSAELCFCVGKLPPFAL